jgi:putative hemolysin
MEILFMALLLIASAFFSASETSLFSLPKYHLRRLREEDSSVARAILTLLSDQHRLLVTILLGNMCVNVLYASFAVHVAAKVAQTGGVASFVIVDSLALAILLVFGEVSPKSVAVRIPFTLSRLTAPFLLAFQNAVAPVRLVLETVAAFILKGLAARAHARPPTATELRKLVSLSKEKGVFAAQEGDLISQVIEFGSIEVREVMTPRVDMVCFHISAPAERLHSIVRETKFGRIPTYTINYDFINGVIDSKDVILHPEKRPQDLVRPVLFVPETARVESVLKQLLGKGQTVAIVVDEFGGTQGLVTIEDIVEEIVGEIEDEYAKEKKKIVELSPDKFLVLAELTVREWNEFSGSRVNDTRFETLGGYVSALLDKVPETDDLASDGAFRFTVKRVDKNRVRTILAERLQSEKESERLI